MRQGHAITLDEQLMLWAEGESRHRATTAHGNLRRTQEQWHCLDCGALGTLGELRATTCPQSGGECCPDFSCCEPHLAEPLEQRRAYVAARAKRSAPDGHCGRECCDASGTGRVVTCVCPCPQCMPLRSASAPDAETVRR